LHALKWRRIEMLENKEFIIQIKGLQVGKHYYDFPICGSFFRSFENSQILDADLQAEIELEKGGGCMNVTATVTGDVTVECDRCLDDVVLPMDFDCTMAVKFAKSLADDDGDEFIIMDPADSELDLSQFLYDYVCLNLPLQKVHPEGECNGEMMAKLGSVNARVEQDDEEIAANSPFGALKGLFDKKN
jgi:uncharacterized metal-binding protein YceD (DUF177 family)